MECNVIVSQDFVSWVSNIQVVNISSLQYWRSTRSILIVDVMCGVFIEFKFWYQKFSKSSTLICFIGKFRHILLIFWPGKVFTFFVEIIEDLIRVTKACSFDKLLLVMFWFEWMMSFVVCLMVKILKMCDGSLRRIYLRMKIKNG